jgi:hypothetical protein
VAGQAEQVTFREMLTIATTNRAAEVARGIWELTQGYLFFAAAPLMRAQLDSLLRLSYVALSSDGEDVARRVVNDGVQFRDLPARAEPQRTLSDEYLKQWVGQLVPWVPSLYDAGNAYVRLSERIPRPPVCPSDRDGWVEVTLADRSEDWPPEEIGTFLRRAAAVTRGIAEMVHVIATGVLPAYNPPTP